MASPYRSSVFIDGVRIRAVASEVRFGTPSDQATGMPIMSTHQFSVSAWFDIHDNKDLQFSDLQKLFELAFRPEASRIQEIKIEYWRDDTQTDAICVFTFDGWISEFRVADFAPAQSVSGISDALKDVNHLLYLEFTPALGEDNIREITIGN